MDYYYFINCNNQKKANKIFHKKITLRFVEIIVYVAFGVNINIVR